MVVVGKHIFQLLLIVVGSPEQPEKDSLNIIPTLS